MNSKRICIIDDEQIVLDSVKRIVEAEGYTAEQYQNSREGLDAALNGQYCCVISDIRMPEIGGMKILRDIKRSKPELPVILITGYATVETAVQAMKLGAAEYIEKPFTPDQLVEKLSTAVQHEWDGADEPAGLVNKDEVMKVLERASTDLQFVGELFYHGTEALREYTLTKNEQLAILTGDVAWIESYAGKLDSAKRKWLEQRLSCEAW
jgi:DNA-binding NtrC family response regulator